MKKLLLLLLLSLTFIGSANAIPNNAHATGNDTWACNRGYFSMGMQDCQPMPPNAHTIRYGGSWECNAGYVRNGYICIKSSNNILIPYNAQAYGDGWKCNNGYVRNGNICIKSINSIFIPYNAHAYGDGWKCNNGYVRSENRCIRKGTIPPNAHSYGNGWECNYGYTQYGYSCIKKPEDETKKPKKAVDDDKVISAASGSGFAVTSDGYVITNYHVIEGCTDVKIHDKGKSILATLVTFDPNNDIALLKGDFKPKSFYPLSRETPKLLTEIYVAGHPFGNRVSTSVKVTKGIVSSLTGIFNNFSNLQIDAAIQPGNSGGPIMNDKGNVIGVAVEKLNFEVILEEFDSLPENVNFGVKANVVINILESENIKLPTPNTKTIPTSELSEMITDGTYYLSCWMTLAQIEQMLETKVMFKDLK